MFTYPHKAMDGKWMVVAEIIDPKDNSMKGGTQFLFNSEADCIDFIMFLSGPAGEKLKNDWLTQKR